MPTVVTSQVGQTGYRDQLDRARRYLDRVESAASALDWAMDFNEHAFQDDMWSLFQSCWHIKDWVRHDPVVQPSVKNAIKRQAERNPLLLMCHDICNGTKHLKLTTPRGGGARFESTEATHESGFLVGVDCWVDDGAGKRLSGKELARKCIAEWEQILQGHGLATARRS
jgi:hypothetical protein